MIPKRISAKLFATDPSAEVDADAFISVFHEFIREKSVEGILIDVADYSHVPEGPGVVLIGHDVDYSIDMNEGKAGKSGFWEECAVRISVQSSGPMKRIPGTRRDR